MSAPDPASLQNLNDIVLPEAAGWWPLAGGWYVMFGLLLVVLAWFAYTSVKRWIDNRYRRAALYQLQLLTEDIDNADKRDYALRQLPVLLKRTALSAYPRSQLASLTGKQWHDFLNSKVSKPSFTESTTIILDKVAYSVGELNTVDPGTADKLLKACRHWLKHHHHSHQGMGT